MNEPAPPTPRTPWPPLRRADLDANPFRQFQSWFERAWAAGLVEPHAMTLATVSPEGVPSARVVLLKSFDDNGFTFFTNYDSQKGRELAGNSRAALVFHWASLARQVRINGAVSRTSREESDAYFRTRPMGSRIGAWASIQSEALSGRDVLEKRFQEIQARHDGGEVSLPPNWGGFRLAPTAIEFWQAQESRLHDRFRYTRMADGDWRIERLAP